jgi:hypothetical protein
MKLSKREKKKNDEVLKLLEKEQLTHDEKCKVYEELNEGYLGDVTANSAFFTGLDLALDFALMAPVYGTVVDLCAGFGVLSYAALIRDTYEHNIDKIILIERNKAYIDIGKKLVQPVTRTYYEGGEEKTHTTEIVWIHSDMFDKKMWDEIEKEYGVKTRGGQPFNCLLSNPPFGTVTTTDQNKSWLKYTGKDLDIASLEIGLMKAEHASYILPQGSCTFRGSGNRKVIKSV